MSVSLALALLLVSTTSPLIATANEGGDSLELLEGSLNTHSSSFTQMSEKRRAPEISMERAFKEMPHVKAFIDHFKTMMNMVKEGKNHVSGERLVVLKTATLPELRRKSVELSQVVGAAAYREIGAYGREGDRRLVVLMKFADEQAARSAEAILRRDPLVKFVVKNYIVSAGPVKAEPLTERELLGSSQGSPSVQQAPTPPNDPLRIWQWNLMLIGSIGTPGIAIPGPAAPPIAVIDTGVDYTHPDLSGKVILGYDYVNDDNDPMDDHGHGTHVAGIAAAKTNNGIGIAGVSPNSNIYAVKVLDEDGSGTLDDVLSGVIEAVGALSPRGVINLSLGGLGSEWDKELWDDIFSWALSEGVVPVCAAGNEANLSIYYFDALDWPGYEIVPLPAASEYCVTVAATQEQDHRAFFSNYATDSDYGFFEVDIVAPGDSGRMGLPSVWGSYGILSTLPGNKYGWARGTSMAAPHVAGAIARVWASFPASPPSDVMAKVLTSSKILDSDEGFPVATPRLNMPEALLAPTAGGRRGVLVNVIDGDTGMPLAGARITGLPGGVLSTTSSGWAVRRNIAAGTYTVTISKTGYVSETRVITVPTASTTEFNIVLVKRKPSSFNTILVTWDSIDPGLFEALAYFDFMFEHPDMPSFVLAGGSGPSPFFCIDIFPSTRCDEEVLYAPLNMGGLSYWHRAAIPYDSRFVWRPVQAMVFRETSDLYYSAYMASVPGWFIFSWGGIPTGDPAAGGVAAAHLYRGSSKLTPPISASTATGTSAFWWWIVTKAGTGGFTTVNQRLPPNILHVYPTLSSEDRGEFVVWKDIATPRVLLVDNDGSAGDTDELLTDYASWYADTLDGLLAQNVITGYRLVDTHFAGTPSLGDLQSFAGSGKAVIIFTGDDSATTFSRFDRDALRVFLSLGGRVLVTGQDIGFDLCDVGNPEQCDWYEEVLMAEYVVDDSGSTELVGVAGDPISDGLIITIHGDGGADNQLFPSVIMPISPAVTVFRYVGGDYHTWPGAVRYVSGSTKVVYFAFGFEAITDPTNPDDVDLGAAMRGEVMSRILNYLMT